MSVKDISEKKLEDYNDVFADILNVLLFKEDLINPEQLADGPTESIYKADDLNLHEQFRDTSKYYQNAGINISSFGIENQSTVDKDMPIRIMGYDYSSYRSQIDKGNDRYPVITIVLNFSDNRWDKPTHLKDMLKIPNGMGNFVQDYEVKVFDIAYLSDDIISQFKSTFKHVAHFFKNKRMLEDYKPLDEEIKHLDAFLELLQVFTGDGTYTKIKDDLLECQKKGQVITMCSVVERFTNEGIQQGIQQGIEQGIQQGIQQGIEQGIEQGIVNEQKHIVLNMRGRGCNIDYISDLTGIPADIVEKIILEDF